MKLEAAWIDRIFERMQGIFGDKWSRCYSNQRQLSVGKITWASGLYGLNAIEIKSALNLCERLSNQEPPTAVEFYHYAKGIRYPVFKRNKTDVERGDVEVAKRYISEIKMKVGGKCGL